MDTPSHENPAPASEKSTASDVLALAPSPLAEIVTRKQLPRTKLGDKHDILKADIRPEADVGRKSIVTRRKAWLRRRSGC